MKFTFLVRMTLIAIATLNFLNMAFAVPAVSSKASESDYFQQLPMSEYILMAKIKTHPTYLKISQEARSHDATFTCKNMEEVLTSKNYSTSNTGTSAYSMIVLSCYTSTSDGYGPVRQMGLVTLSGTDILSFTVADVLQAD